MDLVELHAFLTLCETLHFGRASRVCHMSPSTLTRAIQRLEERLGKELFVRGASGVSLTRAGETFRGYARQTVSDWDAVKAELSDEEGLGGTVSLYASVTAVYSLLPELLENYRAQNPAVQLILRTGVAEEAVPQVMTGDIDLAVAALPDRRPGTLEFLPLRETALVFIGPRGLESVSMTKRGLDLRATALVLPSLGLARKRLDAYLKRNAIRPQVTAEVSGNEAIIAMVRLGCGVGVVPELVLEKSPFRDEVQVIGEAPELAAYEVGLCSTKKSLKRPGVAALWELAGGK